MELYHCDLLSQTTGEAARVTASQPSFMDWMELIGLDGVISDLLAGELTIDDARNLIDDARDTFPNISQDYIALIDRTEAVLADVTRMIEEQEDAVDEFNDAASDFGIDFDHPGDRLLTSSELFELDRLRDDMEDQMQEIADEIEDIGEEIQDLADEMEDLSSEAESGVQDAADELEYAEDELTTAHDELLAAMGEDDE